MTDDAIEHRVIGDRERARIEAEITIEEIGQALKGTKNESSPGATGFTYPFFKMFWPRLKKDRRQITNWRPITLLDCLYKIQSKVIAQSRKK